MTQLRQRMLEDMQIRNFSENTQQTKNGFLENSSFARRGRQPQYQPPVSVISDVGPIGGSSDLPPPRRDRRSLWYLLKRLFSRILDMIDLIVDSVCLVAIFSQRDIQY